MDVAYGIDPDQGLDPGGQQALARLAATLGYASAWTPSRSDGAAFDRCLAWYEASGLPVGISVVPASGQPAAYYAEHAARLWDRTGGRFMLGVGSGALSSPLSAMRAYIAELRDRIPPGLPIYLAALGPRMLAVAGELADGVCLNWCTPAHVIWSRKLVEQAAHAAGRDTPRITAYIRTAVDPDADEARSLLLRNSLRYALGAPAYRRHFERMGIAEGLLRFNDRTELPTATLAATVGAAGAPGEVRGQVERLGLGLELAIVRILLADRGSFDSARRVLEECTPRWGQEPGSSG